MRPRGWQQRLATKAGRPWARLTCTGCISAAAHLFRRADIKSPPMLQGLVQSGFLWGYMATQMIGGALADKHGGELCPRNLPTALPMHLPASIA